jgi:AraC-like DNA-binding protein
MESQNFLRKNIKLGEVASDLKVQPYILSAYINPMYQMRFNDLINWWRIQYVKEGLEKGEWNMLTLEAIADEAGFSNRTTFLNAFKKFTGMTPTAFLSEQANNRSQPGESSQANPLKTPGNRGKPVS